MFSSSTPSAAQKSDTDKHHGAFPTWQKHLTRFWALIVDHPKSVASIILVIAMTLFLTLNVNGYWDFALPLRGKKLLALMVVGYAIGVSTLLFQTLTHNPILTPSLLGFDSLYVLLQSVLVFSWVLSVSPVSILLPNLCLRFFSCLAHPCCCFNCYFQKPAKI